MKKLYVLILFAFATFSLNAQIINIPDTNFKTALLAASPSNTIARNLTGSYFKIDANSDGEIQLSEAAEVGVLNIYSMSISSLTGIDAFTNLYNLSCYNNSISSLDVLACTHLMILRCSTNQLTSLNLQGLTQLSTIYVDGNQLTALNVQGLSNLQTLYCGGNLLTSLNIQGCTNIAYLTCSYNSLTSLNLLELTNLRVLNCQGNNIEDLDFQNCIYPTNIYCGNNHLVSLNLKNGIDSNASSAILSFMGNPNIQYICADDSETPFIQSLINTYGYTSTCHVNSYCSFVPGGTFYTIQGSNHYDSTMNGCDSGDSNYPNLKLTFTNESLISDTIIPDASGAYNHEMQAGTYTITPKVENSNYFTISPTTASVNFPTSSSPFIQNFCITPNGAHQDLESWIIPITTARPGFDSRYKIMLRNKGTVTVSGSLNFSFDDDYMDFVSATPAPFSQNYSILTFNYTDLLPFETREIEVKFNLNTPMESLPLNAGDIIKFQSIISPLSGDEYTTDNANRLSQVVVNSFDPNDKTCIEGDVVEPEMIGEFVHYVIRFENTGTFAAENIVVKDIIDTTKFDISTLIPLNGSHSFKTRVINTNQVEFIFENINLPFDDANNDGYVAFKIKTKPTLVVGNSFSNSSSIYFDYNFPIVTNTATTTITALGTQDFEFSNVFTLSPVPAKNVLTITIKQDVIMSSVNIYNALGQLIQVNTNPNETIDVSGLKTGSYFIKIISDKGTASSKFIKD